MIASQGLLDILAPLGSKAPLPEIRRISLAWKERRDENGPSGKEEATEKEYLTELDYVFRNGKRNGRLGAIELALASRQKWNKKWCGLFLRCARTADALPEICDAVGAKLIGPLWLEGLIEARQLAALALWPEAAPWRAGVTALIPSLSRDSRDWPLLESFLKSCLGEESRFAGIRLASNGAKAALKAAAVGDPSKARNWVESHEGDLPPDIPAALLGREALE